MKRAGTNPNLRQAITGLLMMLALALTDGALVPAGHSNQAASAGVVQALRAGILNAASGSARFANDMLALYQLGRLQELTPQEKAPAPWPETGERDRMFLCSESKVELPPAKSTI